MIKVLLDACVPLWLRTELTEFDVETAKFAGLDQIDDTELIDVIDRRYDVLVTRDRNLAFQQKLTGRSVAIVVVRALEQTPAAFKALLPELRIAIRAAAPSTVSLVGEP